MRKLSVEDFYVLRKPLETGRQSPASLAGALLLGSGMQLLVWFLTYNVAGRYTYYPNIEEIRNIHLIVTIILIAFSILFSIPIVYKKGERIQYLVSILTTQNFGASFFLMALFLLGEKEGINENTLISFTIISMFFGALILVSTFIRYILLLYRGHYKRDSASDKRRGNFEKGIHLPIIVTGSIALIYIIQQAVKVFGFADIETLSIMVLFSSISYAIIYVLPEQLIILYCKYRFKSFTFNERGYLYSETDIKR